MLTFHSSLVEHKTPSLTYFVSCLRGLILFLAFDKRRHNLLPSRSNVLPHPVFACKRFLLYLQRIHPSLTDGASEFRRKVLCSKHKYKVHKTKQPKKTICNPFLGSVGFLVYHIAWTFAQKFSILQEKSFTRSFGVERICRFIQSVFCAKSGVQSGNRWLSFGKCEHNCIGTWSDSEFGASAGIVEDNGWNISPENGWYRTK